MLKEGKVENAMASKVVAFCSDNYHYLSSSIRVPGIEKDELVSYHHEKPVHTVVYRYVCVCMCVWC